MSVYHLRRVQGDPTRDEPRDQTGFGLRRNRTSGVQVKPTAAVGLWRLEVRDFGRGFDPTRQPLESGPGERVGLAGMRERVGALGGRLEVNSRVGVGSTVVATVPLTRVAHSQ